MVEKQPQEQLGRFSDKELKLIKTTFSEQTDLLISIRKVMWGKELTEAQDVKLKSALTKDVLEILRKVFLPELEGDMPLHQEVDLFLTLKFDDKDPEQAYPHIMARDLLIRYIRQQLGFLETSIVQGGDRIILKDLSKTNDVMAECYTSYINLTARNAILMHIEQQLGGLKLIAGTKEETEEEQLKRINANSSK